MQRNRPTDIQTPNRCFTLKRTQPASVISSTVQQQVLQLEVVDHLSFVASNDSNIRRNNLTGSRGSENLSGGLHGELTAAHGTVVRSCTRQDQHHTTYTLDLTPSPCCYYLRWRCGKLEFHGSSFLVAYSWHARGWPTRVRRLPRFFFTTRLYLTGWLGPGGLLRCSAARLAACHVVLQTPRARHPRLVADKLL